ncbi:hypothetical protein ACSSNL_16115 [Thalassobius sp. S69A]|uniref:hypothetical protein n=1 Tax=unclassified Thalassovita TaxID=2619711 RepID=UPI000C0D80B8|nr:hypothetical protein [Paracoccaceae bacterium]MBT25594.1 hypothetical protein [Paracoccaceae bacterium]|tara:strand:- start:171 stop:410 length:240 start_codon:yes stop_codon:yes gene_type:complete
MKKLAMAMAVCSAFVPGLAAAGNALPGNTDPEPAMDDDPFAAASSSAGSLGGAGVAVGLVVAVAVAAALNSGGGTDSDS